MEYTIIKKLGTGSFGVAYLVENDNVKYVMKRINLAKADLKTLNYEVEALEKITKVFDCATNKSALCLIETFHDYSKNEFVIITNYLDNAIPLSQFIRTTKKQGFQIAFQDIMYIFQRLINQILTLHDHDITHGDIKMENIIIQLDNETKGERFERLNQLKNVLFIDYGLSCIKETCPIGGTISYAAPEILSKLGSNELLTINETKATDIWSLAIVLYEVLNYEHPFPNKEDYDQMKYSPMYTPTPNKLPRNKFGEMYDLRRGSNDSDNSSVSYQNSTRNSTPIPSGIINSPTDIMSFSDFYNSNPRFFSHYSHDEVDSNLLDTLNGFVEEILIVNPEKRPTINEIDAKFTKIFTKMGSKTLTKNYVSPRRNKPLTLDIIPEDYTE